MQVPQEFAERLTALDADELRLGDGRSSIDDSLRRLGSAAVRAVPSCRALSVTVTPLGRRCTVVLDHPESAAAILSSLRLRVAVDEQQSADLVLYAVSPGAFNAIADLLSDGVATSAPVLDQDLALTIDEAGLTAQLDDLSAISRATGVLLDRGLPLEAARDALEDRAKELGVDVPVAARGLVAETSAGAPGGDA